MLTITSMGCRFLSVSKAHKTPKAEIVDTVDTALQASDYTCRLNNRNPPFSDVILHCKSC